MKFSDVYFKKCRFMFFILVQISTYLTRSLEHKDTNEKTMDTNLIMLISAGEVSLWYFLVT